MIVACDGSVSGTAVRAFANRIPREASAGSAGAIAGVGSIHRLKAVRWGLAANIIWAWVLTIPASAAIAWMCFAVVYLFHGAV